jgi:hypothetical protein
MEADSGWRIADGQNPGSDLRIVDLRSATQLQPAAQAFLPSTIRHPLSAIHF